MRHRSLFIRRRFLVLALALAATRADSKDITVKGQVGVIGEWALQVSLAAPKPEARDQVYAGVLNLRHVGFCSVEGPEVKTGRAVAPIHDGVADQLALTFGTDSCIYPGPLHLSTKVSRGFMRCRSGFQVPASLWIVP